MVEENALDKVNMENESTFDENTPACNEMEAKWQDILGSGCIMKQIKQNGKSGSRPERLQICKINYECKLEDGTTVEKSNNFTMQLGDCDVIQGLDLAIGLMNVGEICELKIEARLAYGAKGLSPSIPPNTTLIYNVELVSIDDEDDPEKFTVNQRKEMGNKKRERGNWWYGRGENTLAIQCYRRALDYLDELEGGITENSNNDQDISDGELQRLLEDRLNVCNNMAAAQIKLGLFDPALNSLETVLRCQPHNVKALYRKAKIYKAKNEYTTALKLLQKANEVSPEDNDIIKEITSLTLLIKKQRVSEKELAQKMFNIKDNSNQKGRKKLDSKVQALTLFGASVVVGLIGLAMYKYKYI